MIDLKEKMLKEYAKINDKNLLKKTWKMVIYDKSGTTIGESNPFKFTKKKNSWRTSKLIIPILKTTCIASTHLISNNEKMDITNNITWDTTCSTPGTEKIIQELKIELQTW